MAMFVPHGHKQPAVISILRHANRFLLLKRNREPNFGCYTPVGGKLDPFETPSDAAIRETFEETGITISKPRYCGTLVDTSPTHYNWICFVYMADIDDISPPACDEGSLEWIEISEISTVSKPSTDEYLYDYVLRNEHFMLSAQYDETMNMILMKEEISGKTLYSAD
ncbi:MAG: NUDIX hydrolase [Candidatus Wallbacteria bacterium HGW-Wallbacteria-1]|jgi:8-oxo-dGTP diphosphatase|uniref:NUDIX hydrolase n=1 Tax=Candidatus Wallbacteria bacterium HGW-Wallbacteria-1 TaxID=2013854 RepID=A0A2N1PNP1_9BACT|nr:MAG: NUDIX hydrolase [Candidatus Wallbacteria bacterium HGW-Wallbacteria-1]